MSAPTVAVVPVGVLERAARAADAHADEIIGRSHSEANIAREDELRAVARALYAAARGERVDWLPFGVDLAADDEPDGPTVLIPMLYRVELSDGDVNDAWEAFTTHPLVRDDPRGVFCGSPRVDTGCETFDVQVFDADGSTSDLLPCAEDVERAKETAGYIDLSGDARLTVVFRPGLLTDASRAAAASVAVVSGNPDLVEVEYVPMDADASDFDHVQVRASGGPVCRIPRASLAFGWAVTSRTMREAHGLPPRG